MHLLDLPAELRNRIYEYTLTDSTSAGLEYKELSGDSDTQKSCYVITLNKKPFNILKNACRQLRAETTGLELAYNVLIFAQKHITAPQPTRLFDPRPCQRRRFRKVNSHHAERGLPRRARAFLKPRPSR
jgi:hypothetical protein